MATSLPNELSHMTVLSSYSACDVSLNIAHLADTSNTGNIDDADLERVKISDVLLKIQKPKFGEVSRAGHLADIGAFSLGSFWSCQS
jgi:hypothetical protein